MRNETPRQQVGLIPPIGPRAWRLLAGQAFSQIGTGMTFPILLLYLSKVRGINLATTGLVLATPSLAGLFALPFIGSLVDRIGASRALITALMLCGTGSLGFAMVRRPVEAFAVAAIYGVGVSGMWNALSTMFAKVVPPEQRGSIFGVNYALQNLGFGIGATVSGLVLDPTRPFTFQFLFLADAISFLIFAAILLFAGELKSGSGKPQGHDADQPAEPAMQGYKQVLRDRGLLACAALNTLLSAASFSQLNSAFPAWATGEVHATSRLIGFAFLANTITITVSQLFVMRYLLRGRRRTRAVASAALLFGASWLIVLAAARLAAGGFTGSLALVISLVVFALGETILSPSLPALVNDLAPDSLRGRYNAVYSLSWQIGPIIGPIIAGLTLSRGLGALHFTGLAVACGLAALFAIAIERVIPVHVNRGHHVEERPADNYTEAH